MFQWKRFLDSSAVAALLNESDDDLGELTVSEEDSDFEDGGIQEETVKVEDSGRVTVTPPPCTPPPLSPGSQDMFLPSPSEAPPAKRQRVLAACPALPVLSDNSDSSEAEEDEGPVRLRRKKYVPRKDRLVRSIDSAMNSDNFKPHLLPSKETRYKVHLTADRKRNRKERSIVWTTKAPPTTRAGPENMYTKPQKISDKAKAAKSHADLWSLFFTAEMQTKICTYTNRKIQEDIIKKQLTLQDIVQMSHIKPLDEVGEGVSLEKAKKKKLRKIHKNKT
jgi:hypothetical protein